MRRNKLLARDDSKGETPQASRKVVPFSKWLTKGDQIKIVQKDMLNSPRFVVIRQRLSGGEQRGQLVVGVTALTMLNEKEQIIFTHPFQYLRGYRVNESGDFEYTLELRKKETLVYKFRTPNMADAKALVDATDKSGLRLEKVKSLDTTEKVPFFDAEHVSSPRGERQTLSSIEGLRFNVKQVFDDGSTQRVIAIVNERGITVVDPTKNEAGPNPALSSIEMGFDQIAHVSVTATQLTVHLSSNNKKYLFESPDAKAFYEEINRKAMAGGAGGIKLDDPKADATALAVCASVRVSIKDKQGNPELANDSAMFSPRTHAGTSDDEMFAGVTLHEVFQVKTKDYAPKCFQTLRDRWGVTDEDLHAEFNPSKNLYRREVTPGQGTLWHVPSATGKYIAVELTSNQNHDFLDNLESYYKYMTDNPSSVLTRIVAMHRVTILNIYFAVIINPAPQLKLGVPTFQYSLKGIDTRCAPAQARNKRDARLLDQDFVRDHRTVFVTYPEKKKLLRQIASDATLLGRLGHTNYDMFVSVTLIAEDKVDEVQEYVDAARERGVTGIYFSPLEDELYTVRVENIMHSRTNAISFQQSAKAGLNAEEKARVILDPKPYAQRFYDFVKKRIVTSPDPNAEDLEWEKSLYGATAAGAPKSPRPTGN